MALELYILRHAIAADTSPDGSDAARELTEEGRAKMRAGARGLRALGVRPDAILTSPLTRARQTAEIAARELGGEPLVSDLIAPGFGVAQLGELLRERQGARQIMVVGHEPDLSGLVAALTGGSRVLMKKGGLARVDLASPQDRTGLLVWVLPPRALRELGGAG